MINCTGDLLREPEVRRALSASLELIAELIEAMSNRLMFEGDCDLPQDGGRATLDRIVGA